MSTKNRAPRPTQPTHERTRTSGRTRTKSRPIEGDSGPRVGDIRSEAPQIQVQTPPQPQAQPVISIVAIEQLLRGYGCAATVSVDEHGQVVATVANPRMQAEVDRRLHEVLSMKVNRTPRRGAR